MLSGLSNPAGGEELSGDGGLAGLQEHSGKRGCGGRARVPSGWLSLRSPGTRMNRL